MRKSGFTLAEVLITLGIIGVVAALTTPALVKNSGQAKIGPSLAKFVNTFETGIEQMMHKENIPTLYNNVGGSMVLLSKYIVMNPVTSDFNSGNLEDEDGDAYDGYIFTDAEGKKQYNFLSVLNDESDGILGKGNNGLDLNNDGSISVQDYAILANMRMNTTTWRLKDGAIVQIIPCTNPEISKGAYKGVVAEILVDIDGNKSSNRAGKDVFAFLLDATGNIIPAGSGAHKYVGQNGNLYVRSFDNHCALDSTLSHNLACTGKIADNNWKADY